jgi:ABC-type multidrug transport system permease subunit
MPDIARYIGFIIAFVVMVTLLWYVNKKMKKD